MLQSIQNIDFSVLYWVRDHLSHAILDTMMAFISMLGNGGAIWIALGIALLCFRKSRSTGLKLLLALLFVLVFYNWGLKAWVGRLRPFQIDKHIILTIKAPAEFSFPSGHTTSSLAAATVLLLEKHAWRYYALALALLIALSRIYLLVHFPSDVLAGLFLGALMGWFSVILLNTAHNKLRQKVRP